MSVFLNQGERDLIPYLSQFVTAHKLELMESILSQRTRYLTVVMEDLYQSQNTSAIIRTCECLGIQDVHVIEHYARYGTNKKVLKGSHYWIDIIKHRIRDHEHGIPAELEKLKKDGYRILVTSVDPGSVPIQSIDVSTGKIALVMGNELKGISPQMAACADELVHIPMFGFTESFNVSVSAAICLSMFKDKLKSIRSAEDPNGSLSWNLTEEEKNILRLKWLRTMVKRSSILEKEFLRSKS
jgi:tRNA (guanosine-2'-O-)-methyltransferase